MNKPSLLFAAALCASIASSAQKRPNILLFLVDDMGWQDTSVAFADSATTYNRIFHTPNMVRLARQGVMMTNAYAQPISSPSRCSLITGVNSARHRVTNWTFNRNEPTDDSSDTVTLPEWNYNGICRVEGVPNTYRGASFVENLRQSGYHTIHCGKAHFGAVDTPGENPVHFGFEVNISGSAAGGIATYLSELNYGHDAEGRPTTRFAVEGLRDYWGTGTFATEALTQEAIKALKKAGQYGQPWFMLMSHYAVHIPIDRDQRFYESYRQRGLTEKEAAYASLVEGMDKSLGDLLDYVEQSGQADNTVVIFMSDNGGLAASTHWRDGEPHTQNSPLRSGKGSLYEGGIRVPMMVSWPGHSKPSSRCASPVIIEDFFPSILEMASATYDTDSTVIDGISFVPLLENPDSIATNRTLVWNMPNIWDATGPGISLVCAIRQGNWKLLHHYDSGIKELYDLSNDIGETENLVDKHPEIARLLATELGRRLRQMDAQRPMFTHTGILCPWPDE